ncbi:ADI_G0048480.mRNA.1.CDS.1 [Saccharomyces cerevisiae]|uniref:Spindle pole body-associated protein cik1 n=1 Tax=Saccharomyces pastorianus TaxID=27292 RepID=A0A6C1DYH7_SACPS|nr:Cik1p [Saccharomyces cerevisiae YJM993]AJP40892.1 Cik1p [Saccharomyces cerevisiae YJM1078]AJS62063.1 Cik1p [Saccharomyces cerevisiae YJM189]AJS63373.1 Cik1p [Saccharomyces cerevisiae YJM244]AJS64680.1 Cik1p [Saccharomyces cerevisiae YJM271]AJS66421.1 Cik1p [Saccharomyces cerevisiae YJM450]AJS67299.1 Cik1p [Saccharomyces cerevisiae YJM453]AJS69053.1 Cik1p [Saccharomyces cerevisiae YJM554]AJS69929.1 Cik1p [Saccharomyces cerevisiae YJM627]AJS70368.1 Cik1p [Saccharomyces cerevisiae YJM681]
MNNSKIPKLSFHSDPNNVTRDFPKTKRQKVQKREMDMILTPNNNKLNILHSSGSGIRRCYTDDTSATYTKKLTFGGDPKVIERVKNNERKVRKDIDSLLNAISEIEKESVRIHARELPAITLELDAKVKACRELQNEIDGLSTEMDLKDNQCDLQRKNVELSSKNIVSMHAVKVQEFENDLEEELSNAKREWTYKLMEVENLKPDERLTDEMRQLKTEFEEVNRKLFILQNENENECKNYKKELDKKFEIFKKVKNDARIELDGEQERLSKVLKDLQDTHGELKENIKTCRDEFNDFEKRIGEAEVNFHSMELAVVPLKKKLASTSQALTQVQEEKKQVEGEANNWKKKYVNELEKVQQELYTRQNLATSIEEIKGYTRCFAYANERQMPDEFHINYVDRCICENSGEKRVQVFDRVVLEEIHKDHKRLYNECIPFLEKYISKLINCSIIVVSQQPTAPMKKTLLKQLIEQYGENYKMTLNILHLDGSIKHSDVGLDNPTEIRDLSQDEECMNILTLDTKLRKDEESHSMNIYIGSMSTVQLNRELDDAPSVLSHILTKTKQCFVFKINAGENIEKALALAGKLKRTITLPQLD